MRVEIGVGRQLSGIKAHFKQSIPRYMVQQKAPTPKSKVCMEILEHSTKSNLESSSRRSTHSQPRKRTAAAAFLGPASFNFHHGKE